MSSFGNAAAKGGTAVGRYSTAGWETSEFPLVCAPCLGPVDHVRMVKAPFDEECKLCQRPFTVFRWRPRAQKGSRGTGRGAVAGREVKTVVCQTCARHQNMCQACMRDFRFGLEHAQREAVEKATGNQHRPVSDVNQEWYAQQAELDIARGYSAGAHSSLSVRSLTEASHQRQQLLGPGSDGTKPRKTGADIAAARAERIAAANTPEDGTQNGESEEDEYYRLPELPQNLEGPYPTENLTELEALRYEDEYF